MENSKMLTVKTNEGKEIPVIDSREVAEMLGKEHKALLKDINGTDTIVGIIPTLEREKFTLSNYFIESSYKAGTREYKCYLVTKMGCELLGNKQQGEKGILFSAKYVERFNKYEDKIKELQQNPYSNLSPQLKAIFVLDERTQKIEEEIKQLKEDIPLYSIECETLQNKLKARIVNLLGGKSAPAYKDNSLRTKAYRDIQTQIKREFGVSSYKGIARKYNSKALDIIAEYTLPTILENQVTKYNNQIHMNL